MLIEKLKKVSNRHQKGIFISNLYELYIRLYRKSWFRLLARSLIESKVPERWVFVVGCYNSGTTVIKDAIGLHAAIATTPIEGDLLTAQMSNLEEGGWARCLYGNKDSIVSVSREQELDLSEVLKDWAPWIRANKIFMDKAISHSCRLQQLRHTFGPSVKFIVVTRNRDDVVRGIQFRSSPSGGAIERLGAAEYPVKMLEDQWEFIYRLIANDSLKADTHIVSYEDFIEQPESVTRRVFKFLSLEDSRISFRADRLHIGNKSISIRYGVQQNKKRISDFSQLQAFNNLTI